MDSCADFFAGSSSAARGEVLHNKEAHEALDRQSGTRRKLSRGGPCLGLYGDAGEQATVGRLRAWDAATAPRRANLAGHEFADDDTHARSALHGDRLGPLPGCWVDDDVRWTSCAPSGVSVSPVARPLLGSQALLLSGCLGAKAFRSHRCPPLLLQDCHRLAEEVLAIPTEEEVRGGAVDPLPNLSGVEEVKGGLGQRLEHFQQQPRQGRARGLVGHAAVVAVVAARQ